MTPQTQAHGEIAPELVARMVAHFRKVADMRGANRFSDQLSLEALSIAADLPKPVDPDLIEAERIARDISDDFITLYAPARLERLTGHIHAAIKLGREFQKAEAHHD